MRVRCSGSSLSSASSPWPRVNSAVSKVATATMKKASQPKLGAQSTPATASSTAVA